MVHFKVNDLMRGRTPITRLKDFGLVSCNVRTKKGRGVGRVKYFLVAAEDIELVKKKHKGVRVNKQAVLNRVMIDSSANMAYSVHRNRAEFTNPCRLFPLPDLDFYIQKCGFIDTLGKSFHYRQKL